MVTKHQCGATQKRLVLKQASEQLRQTRSINAKYHHQVGTFKNTHIKKGSISKLLGLYHSFMLDLFQSDEYEGGRFRSIWNSTFRVTEGDLEHQDLNEIIQEIENGYRNRNIRMESSHRHYDDLFD
jgi:hypothetical protein